MREAGELGQEACKASPYLDWLFDLCDMLKLCQPVIDIMAWNLVESD